MQKNYSSTNQSPNNEFLNNILHPSYKIWRICLYSVNTCINKNGSSKSQITFIMKPVIYCIIYIKFDAFAYIREILISIKMTNHSPDSQWTVRQIESTVDKFGKHSVLYHWPAIRPTWKSDRWHHLNINILIWVVLFQHKESALIRKEPRKRWSQIKKSGHN